MSAAKKILEEELIVENLVEFGNQFAVIKSLQDLSALSVKQAFFVSLLRPDETLQASFSVVRKGAEKALRPEEILGIREFTQYAQLQIEKRRVEFLMGRLAAKSAVQKLRPHLELNQIELQNDIFNRPILHCQQGDQLALSISHSRDFAVGGAFPLVHPFGIDIEINEPAHESVVSGEMTQAELDLFGSLALPGTIGYTLNWTIKEAYSKAIGVGLTTPFRALEVSKTVLVSANIYESWLTNFSQFRVYSWILGKYVLSIALPYKSLISL